MYNAMVLIILFVVAVACVAWACVWRLLVRRSFSTRQTASKRSQFDFGVQRCFCFVYVCVCEYNGLSCTQACTLHRTSAHSVQCTT